MPLNKETKPKEIILVQSLKVLRNIDVALITSVPFDKNYLFLFWQTVFFLQAWLAGWLAFVFWKSISKVIFSHLLSKVENVLFCKKKEEKKLEAETTPDIIGLLKRSTKFKTFCTNF